MSYKPDKKKTAVLLVSILLFSACGGGGEGGETSTNVQPVAVAKTTRTVNAGVTVVLDGSSSYDEDGQIVSYVWKQIENGSPSVALNDSDSASAVFVAPDAKGQKQLDFQLTVKDNGGAQSTDKVSVDVLEILFSDSFENDNNWDFIDDTGNGASWAISNGRLLQSSFLETDENFDNDAFFSNTSYHSGSYALATDTSLTGLYDYRFSVDITPTTNYGSFGRLKQGNDVGIMFRYQNRNNYYRVSMNARYGFTRFERRKNGNFETLAVNSIGYVDDQPMTMTVEVKGNTIVVWIDGDPVFAEVDDRPISYGTVALYCQDRAQFDNVLITETSVQPMVVISSPLAYSVALTQDDGNNLTAEAVTLNEPSQSQLFFSLDGGQETDAIWSGDKYSIEFNSVGSGEHEVAAVLKDADGNEIDSDINSTVGTGGNYVVAIGDSITNGHKDTDPWNNDTMDGRTVAIQGFEAPLADALTDRTDLPQIVFNEGIGGETAGTLYARLASIMERHPTANKVLLMIGTNDAAGGIDPGSYANSLQNIASTVTSIYGKRLWIAKPPPYKENEGSPYTSWNNFLAQYNQIINEITANSYDDVYLGPNFFTQFTEDLYADYGHPNDAGYQFMAKEWNNKLP